MNPLVDRKVIHHIDPVEKAIFFHRKAR